MTFLGFQQLTQTVSSLAYEAIDFAVNKDSKLESKQDLLPAEEMEQRF